MDTTVSIDYEDAEQVERLRKLLARSGAFTGLTVGNAVKFAEALREFATPTPPKPDEPQGLGAVVEDASGKRFVRTYGPASTADYDCWKQNELTHRVRYSDIHAVRVLSEGVPQ